MSLMAHLMTHENVGDGRKAVRKLLIFKLCNPDALPRLMQNHSISRHIIFKTWKARPKGRQRIARGESFKCRITGRQ